MAKPTRRPTLEERFWPKVDRRGPDECWPWKRSLNQAGYGRFSLNNKHVQAHRIAYTLTIGPIPDGLTIDHLCHGADETCPGGRTCLHRRCVNPAHLEPVTMGVNLLRGRTPPARNVAKTHCPKGHPYDVVRSHGKGVIGRDCSICQREHGRRYDLKRRGRRHGAPPK
jgi:hypothetical protein